jgi:hypothetical protein
MAAACAQVREELMTLEFSFSRSAGIRVFSVVPASVDAGSLTVSFVTAATLAAPRDALCLVGGLAVTIVDVTAGRWERTWEVMAPPSGREPNRGDQYAALAGTGDWYPRRSLADQQNLRLGTSCAQIPMIHPEYVDPTRGIDARFPIGRTQMTRKMRSLGGSTQRSWVVGSAS